ncbi:hypothetical protein CRE_08988 [Caenorhabditis remanei]|uniref:F-box domain-containing protein n=1 Tax=Caenorhabditis remanei TaxID=31234 RepID=E3LIM5_CAERE|nr:hypothetical protein CRE_08988 [Caenorhabditis remanei]
MSEILKTNPTALHTCIYYEFRRSKNVEEAYKNFCEAVGNDVIDYVEFEYWFYRFYHGNLDFDYDRTNDPKPLTINDLPMEMINEIIGHLDSMSDTWTQDSFNVRRVSRQFRPVIDKFKSMYGLILFYIDKEEVQLRLDYHSVQYKIGKNDCFVQYINECNEFDRLNIGLSDLSAVLTNSKTPITVFEISTSNPESTEAVPKFIETLSKEVCPLFYAKNVQLDAPRNDYLIPFLSLFKPGVLEEIKLIYAKLDDDTFAKLVEMDQFKQLRSFGNNTFLKQSSDDYDPISLSQLKQLSHLASFEVDMDHVSAEDIVILRDILSQFANLESAEISLMDPMILSEIGKALGIEYDNSEQITYCHPIKNSDKSLILYIEDYTISRFSQQKKMLDSPHLSAKDLGPLIINNIHQWKTPEKSYKNYEKLCDAIGNKKISFEDFESLFNQYSRKIYLKLEIEEQKDKIYWCVLSDIIHQRPIDNSYSDILEAFGSDVINKKDFEKWLDWSNLRIASKNLTFADLPLDIIRRIIRMADTETQAQLRKLCYFLNIEIGQLDSKCKSVSVEFGPDFIDFNGKISKYTKHGDGKTDYSKYIMEDLAFVLKNQNIHLDSLSTSYNPELDHNKWRDRFETLLKSLKRKIPVKNCSILMKMQNDVVAVLPYLKPGELKSLKFMRDADDGWILFIDRIAALPQWKRAKHVYFDGRIVSCLTEFYHFATFEVHLLLIHPEVLARLTRRKSQIFAYHSELEEILKNDQK